MPDRIFRWWPFVTRWRYETLKQENYALRDALREANRVILAKAIENAELKRYRAMMPKLDRALTEAIARVPR